MKDDAKRLFRGAGNRGAVMVLWTCIAILLILTVITAILWPNDLYFFLGLDAIFIAFAAIVIGSRWRQWRKEKKGDRR